MLAKLLLTVFVVTAVSANAQEPDSYVQLSKETRAALQELDFDKAADLAERLAKLAPNDDYRLRAADALLRSGRAERAVELFDQFAAKHPGQKPYLWQRGIALYFVGRYADGAEQFEVHRGVNPNDVENAAWHYLCVAKKDSPETADKLLLPAPGDPREPMEQVLEMFRNRDPERVADRLKQLRQDGEASDSATFYGELYLGLYADALSERSQALRHMKRSVQHAPRNYMGDVARVYLRHLSEPQSPK